MRLLWQSDGKDKRTGKKNPIRRIARRFAGVYANVWLLCYHMMREQGGDNDFTADS